MNAEDMYTLWHNGGRKAAITGLIDCTDIEVIYEFAKLLVEMEGGGSVGIILVMLTDMINQRDNS